MAALYYAHSTASVDRTDWHRLALHLKDTAARAAASLEFVGGAEVARAAGLLHDLGKYTQPFQRRLEGKGRADHSTAGAKLAVQRYGPILGKMLAFCITGHHAGLADGVTLSERLATTVPGPDPVWQDEIVLPELQKLAASTLKPRNREAAGFCVAFFIRMLFSALVDADYLDTEAYYDGVEARTRPRGKHPALSDLSRRLTTHLDALTAHAPTSAVNRLRHEVLTHVRKQTGERAGVFTLTVPTGGGKTLMSLGFALDHAIRHGMKRIIYVIPYMNIIEQTAAVFRRALQPDDADAVDFVVEHHSTFDEGQIRNREAQDKLRLAMENWDAPIIVTTAVQFFESLFANRPSRCRKLHRIANSVIILDEAQTLPPKRLRPCVTVLDELARNWRASVVLCTATQPALRAEDGFVDGFEGVRELAPEPKRLYQALKRTRICHQGTMDDVDLAERLRAAPQVLCIVNTRRHARELYQSLATVEGASHLTTLMCAHHRRERLATVRERLAAAAPVRLIATSLVEAGVDLDFPVVWRAETGLDSITQAAGRCNREGRSAVADVFVFEPAPAEGRRPPPDLAQSADAARSILRRYADAPTSLAALTAYFQEIYCVKGAEGLDAAGILRSLGERRTSLDFPFESIARDFRMIETAMVPVVIPYRGTANDEDTVEGLVAQLLTGHVRPGQVARLLQPYVVQVPPLARAGLLAAGAAEAISQSHFGMQFVVLRNLDLYRDDVGLTWDDPTFRKIEGLMI